MRRALHRLEDKLLQAAKMSEIGQLSAGIIHEIANGVGSISSNSSVLSIDLQTLSDIVHVGSRSDLDKSNRFSCDHDVCRIVHEMNEILDDILQGVDLVFSITRNLKSLAYSAQDNPKEADINICIEAALRVVGHELKNRVTVEKDFGASAKLTAYPGLLIQLFLNLFTNASKAIDGEGIIKIRTRSCEDGVQVEVSDSGRGIAREDMRRIFQPFFTTKPAGEGLGLGLSICRDIVTRHGGRIEASSARGEGTTFGVWLPSEAGRSGLGKAGAARAGLACSMG